MARGREVHLVTPEDTVAGWTVNTLDYRHIQKRLRDLGVHLHTGLNLVEFDGQSARLACVYSEREQTLACASLVTVTARLPNDDLHQALLERQADWADAGIEAVDCIGDCLAPGLIAHAVYAGHRFAREFEAEPGENHASAEVPFRRRRWVPS